MTQTFYRALRLFTLTLATGAFLLHGTAYAVEQDNSATSPTSNQTVAEHNKHDHGDGHDHSHNHTEHDHGTNEKQDGIIDIYAGAMQKMHEEMHITPSGDPDIDFMRGMIPHHQGAVDMAVILLEHSKDDDVRKLAQEIIRTQEAEIAFMRTWLAKRGAE